MDYEELRPLVLEALRQMQNTWGLQLLYIINVTDNLAYTKGLLGNVQPRGSRGSAKIYMPQEDREKIRQIVWEFILQGILAIGMNEANPDFPFLSITEYGKKVLSSGEILPYDPDGYLTHLKNDIPNLDSMIEMYVTESLQAFLKGLMFSSAVMLGVASERALILLLKALTDATTDQSKKRQLLRLQESYKIKIKFDRVKKEIIAIRTQLRTHSQTISDNLDSNLEGIFNLLRVTRNDAGHPSGRQISRGEAFVNLQLFPFYCKTVYGLIDYLNSHNI